MDEATASGFRLHKNPGSCFQEHFLLNDMSMNDPNDSLSMCRRVILPSDADANSIDSFRAASLMQCVPK